MGYNMKKGNKPNFKDLRLNSDSSPLNHQHIDTAQPGGEIAGWTGGYKNWEYGPVTDEVKSSSYGIKDFLVDAAMLHPVGRGYKWLRGGIKYGSRAWKALTRGSSSDKTSSSRSVKTSKGKKLTKGQKAALYGGGIIGTGIAIDQSIKAVKRKVDKVTTKTSTDLAKLSEYDKWIKTDAVKEHYDVNKAVKSRNSIYDIMNSNVDKNYVKGSSLLDSDKDGKQDVHKLTIGRKELSEMILNPNHKFYDADLANQFSTDMRVINQSKIDFDAMYPEEFDLEKDTIPGSSTN